MAKRLKTYQTSQGFFDLAIVAPPMKAALKAWGANSNLFHQGFAKEADDPKIIAASLEKPGVVLKRPVGTKEPFRENARLPTNLASAERDSAPAKPSKRPKIAASKKVDDETARRAALAYEQERQRESAQRKEEAELANRRQHRERAVIKVEAELDAAERDHAIRVAAIEKERALVDKRAQAEDERWTKLRERLRVAVRKARD
jgi:colicin import membrane protein